MSLEEYEVQLAEKKAALNKKAAVKEVNMEEFKASESGGARGREAWA
jgi:hypothetical protein